MPKIILYCGACLDGKGKRNMEVTKKKAIFIDDNGISLSLMPVMNDSRQPKISISGQYTYAEVELDDVPKVINILTTLLKEIENDKED